MIGVGRSRIQDQVAVAVAVAGLTKRFFNPIQKDFLINVWTVGGIITILGMQAEVAIQSRAATSGSIIISTHHYSPKPHSAVPKIEAQDVPGRQNASKRRHRPAKSPSEKKRE